MKARDIMSCSFPICSIGDSVDIAVKRIQEKKKSFIVIIDGFDQNLFLNQSYLDMNRELLQVT